jgi:hypothetical protein
MKTLSMSLFLVLLLPVITLAQESEYNVKAHILERFTRFIDWPEESAVNDISQPFILGIIGENPFGTILEQIYSQQKIKDKKVEIRYISDKNEIPGCNLLFISKSEKKALSKILSFTRKKPILTVGDTKNFAEQGVLINLYIAENHIRFEINELEARDSGLFISYRLKVKAKIVNPPIVKR